MGPAPIDKKYALSLRRFAAEAVDKFLQGFKRCEVFFLFVLKQGEGRTELVVEFSSAVAQDR